MLKALSPLPIALKTTPYLSDHRFQNKVIYPAVEIMESLAQSTRSCQPGVDFSIITDARFDRFVETENPATAAVFNDIFIGEDGKVISKLLTQRRSRTGITRTLSHASMRFQGPWDYGRSLPKDLASGLEGVCVKIPAERIYRELVPFGPSYHNVVDPFFVSEKGALAEVRGGNIPFEGRLLGSPFPLDAAFHAASVWTQRYAGIVGFPVGFAGRRVHSPTRAEESYICRIIPLSGDADLRLFDVFIFDGQGLLKEEVRGLRMRDVTGGRIKAPDWVRSGWDIKTLEHIRTHCEAFALMDLSTVNRLAEKTLSEPEKKRFVNMGPRRAKSYLSARLCCKSVSRSLSAHPWQLSPALINTVLPDGIRPCCPVEDGSPESFCSVSHDRRFCIAVAGKKPVGVDVEEISARLIKTERFYINEPEARLVNRSSMGKMPASARVWTIKEAAIKAFNMTLPEVLDRVCVVAVGARESRLKISEKNYRAVHDTIDDHVFTLIHAA